MAQPGRTTAQATIHADLDTVFDRLVGANEALDVQLGRALGAPELSTARVLSLASEKARQLAPAARQRAAEVIAQQLSRLQVPTSSWNELRRPTLTQLQTSFHDRRLMRV